MRRFANFVRVRRGGGPRFHLNGQRPGQSNHGRFPMYRDVDPSTLISAHIADVFNFHVRALKICPSNNFWTTYRTVEVVLFSDR